MISSSKGRRFLEYLSPIYEQSAIMQTIIDTIGQEWDDVNELVDEVCNQLFPQTATWGIVYWEALLRIPINKSVPLEQRRARILAKMQTRWPVTRKRMEDLINQFVQFKDARIKERYAEYYIDIILPFSGFNFTEITRLVDDVKPAHLATNYEARAKELALTIATNPRSWHFNYPLTNEVTMATKPGKSLPGSLQLHSRDRAWKLDYPLTNTFSPQGARGTITKSKLEMQAQSRAFLFGYPLCGTFATGEVSM